MKVSGFTLTSQLFIAGLFLSLFLALPALSHAQATNECSFSTTLEMGVIDESVRCLQVYLNNNGFQLATEGPGSPGNETNKFGSLTQAGVIKWQTAKGVSPTSGVFGPKSQAAYLIDLVAKLESQKPLAVLPTPTPQPIVAGASTDADTEARQSAERTLTAVMRMILDTFKELEDERDDDPEEAADIDEDVRDVIEALFDALELYFGGDYDDAEADADEALDDATDAFEDAGGESEVSEAEDLLEDVEDLLEEVKDLFDEAEDRGADVGDAGDMLEEAEDYLDDAREAFDDKIYRQAISDALDAEELLEDAKDEIDVISDDDAERFVEDIWDEYEDAKDEIDEADEDGTLFILPVFVAMLFEQFSQNLFCASLAFFLRLKGAALPPA